MSLSRKRRLWLWMALVMIPACFLGVGWAAGQFQSPRMARYRVLAEYPHDPASFTQGLIVHNGQLIEGTGQYGESKLMRVDLVTGRPLAGVALPKEYFGEGITQANGEIFQLTWKNRVAFVYDAETLQHTRTLRYAGEGWGLTFDGQSLIMSDGSATLRFCDPQNFNVTRRITVREGSRFIKNLNELEYINGEIWANIWYEAVIVRIDPRDGRVLGWIDLSGLKPRSLMRDRDAVHNGIAYDAENRKIYVTGKNWPSLYEIEIVPQ